MPGDDLSVVSARLQNTVARSGEMKGIGVHSGIEVTVRLQPAPCNSGITFARNDLPGAPRVPATTPFAKGEARHTCLRNDGALVATPEHLLAALYCRQIDNVDVYINAPEVPIGDGSAVCWNQLIDDCGLQVQNEPVEYFAVQEPIHWSDGNTHLVALPCDNFRISLTLHYPRAPGIGTQYLSLPITNDTFLSDLYNCRTFCLYEEIQPLIERNLIKGGSLENALVFKGTEVLNTGGLRFPDEPVRHKVLDLVGDLSLVGKPLKAHILAVCSGHAANVALAHRLYTHQSSQGVPVA